MECNEKSEERGEGRIYIYIYIYINFCSKFEIISVFFLPSPRNKTLESKRSQFYLSYTKYISIILAYEKIISINMLYQTFFLEQFAHFTDKTYRDQTRAAIKGGGSMT